MKLTVDDLIKIREYLQPDFQKLEEKISIPIKEDLNILKDLILDIRSCMDKEQLPFIEHTVDQHTVQLDKHEKRIVKIENHLHSSN